MREVDFSERTIAQRWRQVKGVFREDLMVWTRHLLKRLLQGCLEEELEIYLRAAPHARTPTRRVLVRKGLLTNEEVLEEVKVLRRELEGKRGR